MLVQLMQAVLIVGLALAMDNLRYMLPMGYVGIRDIGINTSFGAGEQEC